MNYPANEVYDCRHPKCGEITCFRSCYADPVVPCVNKCFCADGYHRINGICIPFDKCPKEMITCNADETFECREPVCTGLDCFMTERPLTGSPTVPSCEYKCYCAVGLENIHGECVPIRCSMRKAEYKICFNPCTEPSCENLTDCHQTCVNGCFCKDGYYKRFDGECVLLDHCQSIDYSIDMFIL